MLAFGFEQMEDDVHVRKSSLNFVAVLFGDAQFR